MDARARHATDENCIPFSSCHVRESANGITTMQHHPDDDNLREPSHRHSGIPLGMVHEPSARRILPGPQSRFEERRSPRGSDEEQCGLHPVRDEGSQTDGASSEGDRSDGPRECLPGDDNSVRPVDGTRSGLQGGHKRCLHGDSGQDRKGQDGMEIRSRSLLTHHRFRLP